MDLFLLAGRLKDLQFAIIPHKPELVRSRSVPNDIKKLHDLRIPEIDIGDDTENNSIKNQPSPTGGFKLFGKTLRSPFHSPNTSPQRSPNISPVRSPNQSPIRSPNQSPKLSPTNRSPTSPTSPSRPNNLLNPDIVQGQLSHTSLLSIGKQKLFRTRSASPPNLNSPNNQLNRGIKPRRERPKSLLLPGKPKVFRTRSASPPNLSSSSRSPAAPIPALIQRAKHKIDTRSVPRLDKLDKNEDEFLTDFNSGFGHNSWYHGEITIVCENKSSIPQDENGYLTVTTCSDANNYRTGSIIARIDEGNNVSCTVFVSYENKMYAQSIPYSDGYYCLDFSDPDQPRFSSLRLIVGYLVQNKFIERVTFSWLLDSEFVSHL